MFYNYAPLLLALLGTLVGLTGYYLNTVLPVDFEKLLWVGTALLLATVGFTTGRLIKKLNLSSHTDFLTGLRNRRYFHLKLNKEEARAARKNTTACIAMIDVDDFKTVNDTYGHATGDKIISELAAILKQSTRGTDIVTRWGGDEFAIIFPETSLADSYEVMERIRHKIEARFHSPYALTVSAGIIALKPDQDLKCLLITADQLLYKAKARKNSVIVASGRSC